MFLAMNRFKIVKGREEDFERIWRERDTHLQGVDGFKEFNLMKGNTEEDYSLYASHSIWESREHFLNWTKSCLLYTSPSPRDSLSSRMPSSA